jgi:hemerythrin
MSDEEWNELLDEYLPDCSSHYEREEDYMLACSRSGLPMFGGPSSNTIESA